MIDKRPSWRDPVSIDLNDYHQNLRGRKFCFYRATVVDNLDPLRAGRLRLQIPALFGDAGQRGKDNPPTKFERVSQWTSSFISAWGGAEDVGFEFIPRVGDRVMVICDMGDPSFLLWFGAWKRSGHQGKGVLPELSGLARGGGLDPSQVPILPPIAPDPSTQEPKGTATIMPVAPIGPGSTELTPQEASGLFIEEPPCPYAAQYPENHVFKCKTSFIEFDDTEGAERLHIHRVDNQGRMSHMEWHPNGDLVIRTAGDVYEINEGNRYVVTTGDKVEEIKGDHSLLVRGDQKTLTVGDDYSTVGGIRTDHTVGDHIENILGNHIWTTVGASTWTFSSQVWTIATTAVWTFGSHVWTIGTAAAWTITALVYTGAAVINELAPGLVWWFRGIHLDKDGKAHHDED